ncbi:acyl carrier protein [Fredinandcohnia sp. QZ13]|uniref:acyl carrier protein n=1 Tax=Fredinandcohnia sp. QZ13 TaxID=3073144 RepID=UPI002853180B|nr:acyl carrier protein [Fredinandcohnia sp. QZ13]MDR4889984.1 acyl carrier protein [Fredinandcohnia sp. QZ13]
MDRQEFLKIFAEDIVMVEPKDVTLNTVLDELEDWDSLAIISLNAALDEHFGFTLNQEEIKNIETVSDILTFIYKKSISKSTK